MCLHCRIFICIFRSDFQIYSCDLCSIQVTSINVLRRHKEGRKHLMRMERQGKTFSCELCEITANSQSQLDAHLRSKKLQTYDIQILMHCTIINLFSFILLTGSKHKARLTKRDHPFRLNRGACILIFCCFCIIINFILLYKVAF